MSSHANEREWGCIADGSSIGGHSFSFALIRVETENLATERSRGRIRIPYELLTRIQTEWAANDHECGRLADWSAIRAHSFSFALIRFETEDPALPNGREGGFAPRMNY